MQHLSRRGLLKAAAGIAAVGVAAGCGPKSSSSGGASKTTGQSGAKTKITIASGFGAFGREAHLWVAKKNGYYDEEGLDVTIQPGAAGDANDKLLESGQIQFAEVDYAGTLLRVGNHQGSGKVIAVVNQTSITALMAAPNKGISRATDLAGKKIGATPGALPVKLFPGYAKLAGLDPKSVTWVNAAPQALPSLLAAGKIDAITQYVPGKPLIQAAIHADPVVLPYSKYITDMPGFVLVTTEKMTKENPDLCKRFVRATLRGLQYMIDHPDETGQIFHGYLPQQNATEAAEEVKLITDYVTGDLGGRPLGTIDTAKIARSIAIVQGLGLIPGGLTADQLVFNAVPDHA